MRACVGVLEVMGMGPSFVAADAMVKAADVRLVGIELAHQGGLMMKVIGSVGEVEAAVSAGRRVAEQLHAFLGDAVRPRYPDQADELIYSKQQYVAIIEGGDHMLPGETEEERHGDPARINVETSKRRNVETSKSREVETEPRCASTRSTQVDKSTSRPVDTKDSKVGWVKPADHSSDEQDILKDKNAGWLSPTPSGAPDMAQEVDFALGLIETQGLTAMIEAADAALKAANVTLVGKEKIGAAYVTIMIKGDVAAVKAAVEAGTQAAQKVGKLIAGHVIPRPHRELATLLPR
jgi:ethanolamine utilization protein EutM